MTEINPQDSFIDPSDDVPYRGPQLVEEMKTMVIEGKPYSKLKLKTNLTSEGERDKI